MKYIYTSKNQELQEFSQLCLNEKGMGAYLLVGPSGCGKTTFLRTLEEQWKECNKTGVVTWLKVEDVVKLVLEEKRLSNRVETSVIFLENMEELCGKETTISSFWKLLEEWLDMEQGLFIGNTNCRDISIADYAKIIEVEKLDITEHLVSSICNEYQVCLNEAQRKQMCMDSQNSVSRLIGLVKKEKINNLTQCV